jgi:ribose transport system permease protein
MNNLRRNFWLNHPYFRDYGMIFVLVILCGIFSVLTIEEQHPTGKDAGREVADKILAQHGTTAKVVIVTRKTPQDLSFADAADKRLKSAGATVLANVNGIPIDVRSAIESLGPNAKIDAIAATAATANWPVYDKIPGVGSEKCVTPYSYSWPGFLKVSNLLSVANATAIYAIIAIGMTLVIVTAGIDLSVGSLIALSAVCAATLIRDWGGGSNASLAVVIASSLTGIGICAIAGLFNGFMITAFRMPSFIVSLGMMMMANGLAYRLSEGESIPELPPSFFWLGGGVTFDIPNPVLLMIVLYAIAHVVLSRMVFGRYVYAIGGNEEVARLSGVPVKRVLLMVYTISGALAGLGGIVLASQLHAGDPKYGERYELEVIVAVVAGGTSLMGGYGKIFGTLIGAFIIAVIKNGLNYLNVDTFNQKIVLGAVLIIAVLLDTLKRRGMAK